VGKERPRYGPLFVVLHGIYLDVVGWRFAILEEI
jgi:hypothetical protein